MDGNMVRGVIVAGAIIWSGIAPVAIAQAVAVDAQPVVVTKEATVSLDAVDIPLETVLRTIARQAGLRLGFKGQLVPPKMRVTVRIRNVPPDQAFAKALAGTALHASIVSGNVVLDVAERIDDVMQGEITGRILDAQTKRPLPGVSIVLDEARSGVVTNDEGVFRISGVAPGQHLLGIRLLGYTKTSKTVMVAEGEAEPVEVVLGRSVSTLDQVVVTGTVVQTELKAVPNAITVITAKQLEERGITQIQQLFRGDVPGLVALNQGSSAPLDEVRMFSRGATTFSEYSAGTQDQNGSSNTNPIKTYIDGVELADPKYLSQIDPRSIERIEILAGPQASTIYGSNAINGVMQIFTKRGTTSSPQLTLNLQSGWVENNFSPARTPQHDDVVQVSGIEGHISYNAGGSWEYMGPWTPSKQTTRMNAFGGARLEMSLLGGRMTNDVTLRLSGTQNIQRGDMSQAVTEFRRTGFWQGSGSGGVAAPTTSDVASRTLGWIMTYAPTVWWSQEFGVGQDASETESRNTKAGYRFRSDTGLSVSQNHSDRRSLHYTTTLRAPLTELAQVVITGGVDGWQGLSSSTSVTGLQRLTGSLPGSISIFRQPDHNRGGFVQTQLGLVDHLFLTYGLRAEWNPAYGKEVQPNYAPRYGASYTQDFGLVTTKLRASYGRSTRPPQQTLKAGQKATEAFGASWSSFWSQYFDNFDYTLPNPELAPEHQQGGEGGLELYFGTRGSLVVTRYNQTIDDIIDDVGNADSIRTKYACEVDGCPAYSYDANGFGYWDQDKYLNIGSIRNQGWELQGSVNVGPFTTKGTYSWTKSRVLGVNPRYRAYFAANPEKQAGATFLRFPEHTWAVGMTYARAMTTLAITLNGIGQTYAVGSDFYNRHFFGGIRLKQNIQDLNSSGFSDISSGYIMADVNATHRLFTGVDGTLQVNNLANRYVSDFNGAFAVMGRQTKIGLRWRL